MKVECRGYFSKLGHGGGGKEYDRAMLIIPTCRIHSADVPLRISANAKWINVWKGFLFFYIGLALGHGKKRSIVYYQLQFEMRDFLFFLLSLSFCTAEVSCADTYWHFLWNALKWALMNSVGEKPLPRSTNIFFSPTEICVANAIQFFSLKKISW